MQSTIIGSEEAYIQKLMYLDILQYISTVELLITNIYTIMCHISFDMSRISLIQRLETKIFCLLNLIFTGIAINLNSFLKELILEH